MWAGLHSAVSRPVFRSVVVLPSVTVTVIPESREFQAAGTGHKEAPGFQDQDWRVESGGAISSLVFVRLVPVSNKDEATDGAYEPTVEYGLHSR